MADFVSPFLRLDSSCWSSISPLLAHGDLIRLLCIGCPRLTSRLKDGAHNLHLEWLAPGYIEFDGVFSLVNRFKLVSELNFRCPSPQQLCWMPVNWYLLPKTLVTLKLDFFMSTQVFMHPGGLNSMLPHLEILHISNQASGDSETATPIVFRELPHNLREISICSTWPIITHSEDFDHLPPRLETLRLAVNMSFWSKQVEDDRADKKTMLFQSLPRGLTFLELGDTRGELWSIDCANLPASLTTLIIGESCAIGPSSDGTPRNIDLAAAKASLRQLRTLDLENCITTPNQVFQLVPPSVTALYFDVTANEEIITTDVAEFIATRLMRYQSNHSPDWDLILLGPKFEKPKLELVDMEPMRRKTQDPGPYYIPPSVKHLFQTCSIIGGYPVGLETLSLSSLNQVIESSFGDRLRKLHLYFNLDRLEDFALLPATLETLSGPFSNGSWNNLVSYINKGLPQSHLEHARRDMGRFAELQDGEQPQGPRLPNLREVKSKSALALEALLELPPQFTILHFIASPGSLSLHISEAVLHALKHSRLVKLDITLISFVSPTLLATTKAVMNNLPETIRDFTVRSSYRLAADWSVILPTKLRRFVFLSVGQSLTLEKSIDCETGFKLPSELSVLKIPAPIFHWSYLPPHLSVLKYNDAATDALAYFANRKRPTSANPTSAD